MLPKQISSPQHPTVKEFVKLRTNRKFRYEKKRVVISGIKQVTEAVEVHSLLVEAGKSLPNIEAQEIFFVDHALLKKISGHPSPEPLVATVPMPKPESLEKKDWILVLDRITDPGNMGTLIRAALALGWEGAFLTDSSVDPFNEKALRSGMGAAFRLPLCWGTSEELIQLAKKHPHPTWVGDMSGMPLTEVPPSHGGILILGSEAHGVSASLKEFFSPLSIPIRGIESLNVAAAGAIFLYNLKK